METQSGTSSAHKASNLHGQPGKVRVGRLWMSKATANHFGVLNPQNSRVRNRVDNQLAAATVLLSSEDDDDVLAYVDDYLNNEEDQFISYMAIKVPFVGGYSRGVNRA